MIYKLYVEVDNRLHLVAEDNYLSNLVKIIDNEERQIAEKYNVGLPHFIILGNNRVMLDEYRYRGQAV